MKNKEVKKVLKRLPIVNVLVDWWDGDFGVGREYDFVINFGKYSLIFDCAVFLYTETDEGSCFIEPSFRTLDSEVDLENVKLFDSITGRDMKVKKSMIGLLIERLEDIIISNYQIN